MNFALPMSNPKTAKGTNSPRYSIGKRIGNRHNITVAIAKEIIAAFTAITF
jgi:hypothetical protein